MYEIKKETLEWAHKPMDIVSDEKGSVGFINEVSVNHCQSSPESQICYSITWLTGDTNKSAWFEHHQLTYHCNLMVKIIKNMCHPMGSNSNSVEDLLNHCDFKRTNNNK